MQHKGHQMLVVLVRVNLRLDHHLTRFVSCPILSASVSHTGYQEHIFMHNYRFLPVQWALQQLS